MHRRQILVASGAMAALIALPLRGRPARAEAGQVFEDDHILGDPEAPVTIIEFSSLTCPHCAAFHKETLPEIRKNWIDGGKARLVYRHFPLDGLALMAAAVANCLEGAQHFALLDLLFRSQSDWTRIKLSGNIMDYLDKRCAAALPADADDPLAPLKSKAKFAGIDDATFQSCLCDQAGMNGILARAQDGQTTYDVQSTPTFVINGTKLVGARSYEDFDKALTEAAARS